MALYNFDKLLTAVIREHNAFTVYRSWQTRTDTQYAKYTFQFHEKKKK